MKKEAVILPPVNGDSCIAEPAVTVEQSDRSRTAIVATLTAGALLAATGSVSPKPAPAAIGCDAGRFRIALDVGHTVESPGATSARGVKEHTFNLNLARRIASALKDGGFPQTQLVIVHGTGRAQLLARAARANSARVDLFLSIHHDDVQAHYYARWQFRGTTYNYSDKFSGYSLFVSQANKAPNASLAFAKLLGAELQSRDLAFTPSHAEPIPGEGRALIDSEVGIYRYDDLVVLRQTNAPAVLLEAGIIVNRADELALGSQERRSLIAEAVLASVNRFCSAQQARPPLERR